MQSPQGNPEATPREQLGRDLTERFADCGFTPDGLAENYGAEILGCIARGEPAPVELATEAGRPIDHLVRAAILHLPADLDSALGTKLTDRCAEAGLVSVTVTPSAANARQGEFICDIRPHTIGGVTRWVFSDPDPSMHIRELADDHVMGLGAASRLMLDVVPTTPVARVLDLGTGAGTLLLSQVGHARELWGTDISRRAVDFATLTLAGTGVRLAEGSWFEPVQSMTFDRIIANPPFVIAPPGAAKTYRQSTFALDGATRFVVNNVRDYLNEGATAHILGAWALGDGEAWEQHVASFVPAKGVCCWAIQRDEVSPAAYTAMFLRDEGIDPRSDKGKETTRAWLSFFAEEGLKRIGLGMIHLSALGVDQPSEVFTEEILTPIGPDAGAEVAEFFTRAQWLREQTPDSLLSATYLVRPTVAKEDVALPDTEQGSGWTRTALRLTRTDGFAYTHEIDDDLYSLLSGLHPQGLSLGEVCGLFALAHGLDEDELTRKAVPLVTALIQHGMILPADLVSPQFLP